MAGGVFLLKGDGQLVGMQEKLYDSEALLQKLLMDYPDLLAGDQMDSVVPRRWLHIGREAAIPSEDGGGGRWSADHLFLDQDAVPTIIEVKRSDDTRIRREVVGQMLEYAANAVLYWPADSLQELFEDGCRGTNVDPERKLADFLGDGSSVDHFWRQAMTNLQAGRIRLVFVADEIPAELRRITEFLSAQMTLADVLAVEIKQYVGQDFRTLVPRVFGGRGRSEVRPRSGKEWDEKLFLADLAQRKGAAQADTARRILEWANRREIRLWWGKGAQDGSFFPMLDWRDQPFWLFSVWTYGRLEVQFEMMRKKPPFADEGKRADLLRRLNEIPGIRLPADSITRRPSISLEALQDDTILTRFLAVFDWVSEEIKRQ